MAAIAASAGYGLLGLLPALARFVGFASEDRENGLRSTFADELAPTLEAVAAPILSASDLDDLDYQIDLVLMEDRLQSDDESSDIDETSALIDPSSIDLSILLEPLTAIFGVGCAPLLKEALQLLGNLFHIMGEWQPIRERLGMRRESSLWFLHDQTVPVAVSQGLLDFMRFSVCFEAMAHAVFRGIRPEPWLARALCERLVRWLQSSRPAILALGDSSAMVEEYESARETKTTYDALLEKAKSSGLDVYPPLSER